jgi:hypothetical protein
MLGGCRDAHTLLLAVAADQGGTVRAIRSSVAAHVATSQGQPWTSLRTEYLERLKTYRRHSPVNSAGSCGGQPGAVHRRIVWPLVWQNSQKYTRSLTHSDFMCLERVSSDQDIESEQ